MSAQTRFAIAPGSMQSFNCPVCGGKSLHYANCPLVDEVKDEVYAVSAILRRPRVLACGGRGYSNEGTVDEVLSILNPQAIGEGGALGADLFAENWVKWREDIEHGHYPPLRGENPYERNRRQLRAFKPDLLVSFLGGNGTHDMETMALRFGVWVWKIEE